MCCLDAVLLIGPNAARGLGRRQRLHLRRNAECVEKIGQRQLSNLQALASARDHQSACRQPLQRFADRRAGNTEMIGELPLVEMIINRAAELDETFGNGAVPEFLITLEAARSGLA